MTELVNLSDLEDAFLDAVDFQVTPAANDYDDDANSIRFRLNGVTYVASEDPSDGYRSSMREIRIEEKPEKLNVFPAVLVHTNYADKRSQLIGERDSYGDNDRDCDILQIIDTVSGAVIATIGTDNSDDYYPSFVGHFDPTKMTPGSWDALQAQIAAESAEIAVSGTYTENEDFGSF